MFRRIIAKSLGLSIQDKVKKTHIRLQYKNLRRSQNWPQERLDNYRLSKLKQIVIFAYNNVPYYKRVFDDIGLKPEDIKSVADINKLPILNKETIRKEGDNLLATNFNFGLVKVGKTGGTTGVPTKLYKDNVDRSITWAAYYRWYEWMNLSVGDKEITFWGAKAIAKKLGRKTKIKSSIIDFLFNKNIVNSFNITPDNTHKAIELMNKLKPKLIKGYLSSLLKIADYIIENKIELKFIPRALSTTTETLLPHHRNILKLAFKAEVYDQYGCGEVGSIAFECSMHEGLHINQEHVIVEILDEKDKPVLNKTGRIIVTNLDNYVMPIIRFENGDLSNLSGNICKCGVNQPLLKSIEGRLVDTIILKGGESVHGVFFTTILFELNILSSAVSRFQVYQDQPGKIELRLETKYILDEDKSKKLKSILKEYFCDVSITYFALLPCETNGKFKYVISDIQN